MTRESLWKKWGHRYHQSAKKDFMADLTELIEKHQAPYISALGNISTEIEALTEGEVKSAETTAKRLG